MGVKLVMKSERLLLTIKIFCALFSLPLVRNVSLLQRSTQPSINKSSKASNLGSRHSVISFKLHTLTYLTRLFPARTLKLIIYLYNIIKLLILIFGKLQLCDCATTSAFFLFFAVRLFCLHQAPV